MEALKFMRQRKRMCDYYGDDTCVCDDSRGTCPALAMDCSFGTGQPERLIASVELWEKEHPEKPEQERQKPEHPEKSGAEELSDLYATIASLEDRLSKLETRIAALEKYPVESTPEPKRTNKDMLLAAFPDACISPDGIPDACPLSLDKHYDCGNFRNCKDCRTTYWPRSR